MKNLFFYFFSVASILLTSCEEEEYYPKVTESLMIANETDSHIIIEYGFTRKDTFVEKVILQRGAYHAYSINSVEYKTWMSESQFNDCVKQLKIYRIENGDTLFVDPVYYDKKSAWSYSMYSDHDFEVFYLIQNSLKIQSEMFNN